MEKCAWHKAKGTHGTGTISTKVTWIYLITNQMKFIPIIHNEKSSIGNIIALIRLCMSLNLADFGIENVLLIG